jgi:hypothetical protein
VKIIHGYLTGFKDDQASEDGRTKRKAQKAITTGWVE